MSFKRPIDNLPAIRILANAGKSSMKISKSLGMKDSTVRALCIKHSIPLLHRRGRPRVPNPVRPYRSRQKQYYQKIGPIYTGRDKVLPDPFGEGKL